MKNYGKYLTGIAVIAVAITTSVLWNYEYNTSKTTGKSDIKSTKGEGISGALDFYRKIRINHETGKIDVNDVKKAIAQRENLRQKKNKTSATTMVWKEMGPDNVGGRVRGIIIDKNDHNTMWAGSVSGGLWKSTTLGSSWEKVTNIDNENLAVSCITQAANGDIYYGTGEEDLSSIDAGDGQSSALGAGVFKSSDGGSTFSRLSSTWETSSEPDAWENVNRLGADPSNSQRIYAATNNGLRRSDDGGATWSKPISSASQVSKCLAIAPNGSIICDQGGGVYISTTGDDGSFTKVSGSTSSGLIGSSSVTRFEFGFAPSDPNYVYCVTGTSSSTNGLGNVYQSTDGGYTWSVIGPGGSTTFMPVGVQAHYAIDIAVHPTNPEKIYVGGLDMWTWSATEGWAQKTYWNYWEQSPYYLHADQHIIIFHPDNPDMMYFGNDGGVFQSKDGGETYSHLVKKFNTTQCYAVAFSKYGHVMSGNQDNGTQYINYQGNTLQTAQEVVGGDGNYCDFSMINPDASFASVYYGDARRASTLGGSYSSFYPAKIVYGNPGDAAFITPLRLWESFDSNGNPADTSFVVGFNGALWMTKEALDFSITPEWFKVASFSGSEEVNTMAFSTDGDHLFVATNQFLASGKLYCISNLLSARDSVSGDVASDTSNVVITQIAGFNNRIITSISVNPNDADHVIITLGNFGNSDYVYETTTATTDPTSTSASNLTSLQADLPEAPVYSSLINKNDPNIMFVGTEYGVYMTENGGSSWTVQEDIPAVPTFMIRQQTHPGSLVHYSSAIYVATHGRGIFMSESLVGIDEITASKNNVVNNLNIYPNPVSKSASLIYNVNETSDVIVKIYDLKGQFIKSINLGSQTAGSHKAEFDVNELRSGTYMMSVNAGNSQVQKKFIVLK